MMNKERALELLNAMAERIVTGENLNTSIRTLIEVGFKKEEMEELHFRASDIEEVYEEIMLEKVDEKLKKFSADKVAVVCYEEDGNLYVVYYSGINPFPLSDVLFHKDDVNLNSLETELKKRNVGLFKM